MKKIIVGVGAILLGGGILIGSLFLPQRDPFVKQPSEMSPLKENKVDITENNRTISDFLRGYSTLSEMEKDGQTSGDNDNAYYIALDNKGEPGGWLVSPSGKSDKLMGGESKKGKITNPIYANDPNGATLGDIKKALEKRDKQFAEGTLKPNIHNNRTMYFMIDTYKTKKAFEEWYKSEKISPSTRILKSLYDGVVIDHTEINGAYYDLKTDSNSITVAQILSNFP